jgi:hypothetical protein
MKTHKAELVLICISISAIANSTTLAQAALAQGSGKPYEHTLQITGKEPGPYNIRASVEPTQSSTTALMNQVPQAQQSGLAQKRKRLSEKERQQVFNDFLERWLTGEAENDVPVGDPFSTQLVNQAIDLGTMQNDVNRGDPPDSKPPRQQRNQMANNESHHQTSPGSGPESHHHLPTDGSPNSEAITTQAIETFYGGLPPDITDRLAGLGINPMATVHGAGDPYAPYAMALQRGDFSRMRDLANSDAISDWNERISMLGLAGATALRNLSNPNNPNSFAAKDALRKIAEDLHYAGQGLSPDTPNDAKLKATCDDISRIWGNMTNQGQKPPAQ